VDLDLRYVTTRTDHACIDHQLIRFRCTVNQLIARIDG